MFRELEKVVLADGRVVDILEVFNDGEAYLVDIPTPDGEHAYEQGVVYSSEIDHSLTEFE